MRLGSLELTSKLCLSPLAGYTNLPFRLALRELVSFGLATTDLINARSLIERNPKALKLIETRPADHPLSVQLFGAVPEEMRDAARILEDLGYNAIDINMGCPVRKVCRLGGGSAMLTDLERTARLVKGIVDAVKLPVTAKMRLGWDAENLTAPDLAKALADVGVAGVFVHGRTRAQGFGGVVNLEGIRQVVEAVPGLPVIGNGDVVSAEAAAKMLAETGCAGLSIGRGAFYNPWIFQQIPHHLATGQFLPEAGYQERVAFMRRHLACMVEVFGEDIGCRMFRKIGPMYARCFGPSKLFIKRITMLAHSGELDAILAEFEQWRKPFLSDDGELKPAYRPVPLHCSFLHPESAAPHDGIGVPKGPVERW